MPLFHILCDSYQGNNQVFMIKFLIFLRLKEEGGIFFRNNGLRMYNEKQRNRIAHPSTAQKGIYDNLYIPFLPIISQLL